ncbi:hypothetical protein BGX24_004997, partial [Mortierella sp. AD032]
MLTRIATEETTARVSREARYRHQWNVALAIRRQDTEAINAFRICRQAELHKAVEPRRLKDQHALVIARLYETIPNLKRPFDNAAQFPLQDKYHLHPTENTSAPTKLFGPLLVPTEEFDALTALQDSPVDNTTPRIIYSDGSLVHSGTEDIAMAFGVVDLRQDNPLSVKGRTDGHASSAKAELMGLLAAVVAVPPDQDITV